ncbi:MAG: rhomboid family intramembrane serine protease, partial [Lachnospiraceae bacterium]|nr:rhomboid family intramembrane serine protease [Lachnospiraceae bacterium]
MRRLSRYITPANTIFIIANIVVFIYLEMKGDTNDATFMLEHGAEYWPAIEYNQEYWRLLTAAFLHFGAAHLINNMIVLAFLGDNLERALGTVKYIIFYTLGAMGSNLCSFLIERANNSNTISAGASGAIFAVVGGMLYILIVNRGHLEDLNQRNIILFIAFSLYMGFTTTGINNIAHISGLAIGFVLAAIMYRRRRKQKR